jgi:type IV pilus assembly protein PilY1
LTALTSVTQATTIASNSKGWYYDLGLTSNVAFRVVVNPIAYNGIVVFSALLTSGDACTPTGNSEVYALNYATGVSVLQPTVSNSTTPAAYYSISGSVTSEKVFIANGTANLDVGTNSTGLPTPIPWNPTTSSAARILNWREIPTAE